MAGKQPAKGSALPWILGGVGVLLLLVFGAVVLVIVAVANAEPDPKPAPTAADTSPRLELPSATATAKPTATGKPGLGPFPRAKATSELDRVIAGLGSCRRVGDPIGTSSILVDFEPDGRVSAVLAKPFAGTVTGTCISARFQAIKIGAFSGVTQPVQRTFTISAPAAPSDPF